MSNGHVKTLVEEVFETMPGPAQDIGSQLCPHRVLVWFKPQKSDSSYLLRLISILSKRLDWELFDPGITPIVSVHSGSIYSFKEFAQFHAGINEADAVVFGTSSIEALQSIVAIIESMGLENFVKFEEDTDSITQALHIIPLYGLLCYDTWVEATPAIPEYELIERRHEVNYGLEIKRPRDSVEGDLFKAHLDETTELKLMLKIVARKMRRRLRPSDGILRSWDLLSQARLLLNYGCVNEAGVVAGSALEELLIALTNLPYEHVKRDRIMIGKIISVVEKNKKLHPGQTKVLREFAELRAQCARAITSDPQANGGLAAEVAGFINWLDSYPDWLR